MLQKTHMVGLCSAVPVMKRIPGRPRALAPRQRRVSREHQLDLHDPKPWFRFWLALVRTPECILLYRTAYITVFREIRRFRTITLIRTLSRKWLPGSPQTCSMPASPACPAQCSMQAPSPQNAGRSNQHKRGPPGRKERSNERRSTYV